MDRMIKDLIKFKELVVKVEDILKEFKGIENEYQKKIICVEKVLGCV